ncbi:EAL domain-containing protein [Clostridium sartagoforme]|uniref:EAL domain-containing protein n=1 Tax=Clostridium sartagoforme TaxID=84031 RepID=A0A4S2DI73_9CLOT|nr:EAL domain-containing protein [Clostridium sartagoforme]TGY41839.1 EAL domain-containing protein [Clostridium sartagoforme]
MKRKRNYTLKVVAAFFVTIVFALICSFTYLDYMRNILNNDTKERLLEVADRTTDTMKIKLQSGITELKNLSTAISLKSGYNTEEMKDVLYNYVKESSFQRIELIDPNGDGYSNDFKDINFSDREYFQKAMNGEVNISNFMQEKVSAEIGSTFAVPIFNENNEVIGVLAASKEVSEFKKLLDVNILGGEGYLALVDSSGAIITSQNHKNYDSGITDLREVKFENNNTFVDCSRKFEKGVLKTQSSSNDSKYIAYAPIGINNWYIISIVPASIIEKNITSLNNISSLMWISMSILLLIIVTYIIYSKRKADNKLEKIAFVDSVTNDPNYNSFFYDFNKRMSKEYKNSYALVTLDIDKFKVVNDVFGYENGDDILRHMAFVICENLTQNEIYARHSADNFLILLEYIDEDSMLNRMDSMTIEILNNLDKVIKNMSGRIYSYKFILNYGICIIDDKKDPLDLIVDRANLAKKRVKGSHKTTGAIYTKDLREKMLMEKELENYMDKALREKQFKVYFQPEVSFKTGKIIGAEALVRWYHPEKGIIYPDKFIPLFEKNQFIKKLDYYMFNEVAFYIQKWESEGIVLPKTLSINLSRVHLSDLDLVDELLKIVKDHNVEPSKIGIELTESAFFEDTDLIINVMERLKNAGFKIYIDDFGSGYSSLNTLKDLKVDYLKFDRGFLTNLEDNKKGQAILHNLVNMARDISICTVAEGVETVAQANFLSEKGFDIAQGYYYYKPMTAKELRDKLINDENI